MRTEVHPNARWDLDHDPDDRPLGCNGRYGKSGAAGHYYRGEPRCDACAASQRHYEKERARGQLYPRVLKPCGTVAAAKRHQGNNEPMDFECSNAIYEYEKARREKRKRSGQDSNLHHPVLETGALSN